MIYNDEFVWLHFPKCAGTKIELLFEKYFSDQAGIKRDIIAVPASGPVEWHDSIAQREARDPAFRLGDRTVICAFRRLPFWLESRYSYEVERNPGLFHSPRQLLDGFFLEAWGQKNDPDHYARRYLPESILGSGRVRFVRVEHFEADFKAAFGGFIDLSRIPDFEYRQRVNVSRSRLPEEVRNALYDSTEIYKKCPYWARIEKMAYGYLPDEVPLRGDLLVE